MEALVFLAMRMEVAKYDLSMRPGGLSGFLESHAPTSPTWDDSCRVRNAGTRARAADRPRQKLDKVGLR